MAAIVLAGVNKYTSKSTAELDSHASMIVIGNQALVIQNTGQSVELNSFSSDVQGISKVPGVDAVVLYYCLFTSKSYLLVMLNALHIPSMKYNLIPLFILREVGLTISEVPKIHCDEPIVEDRSIYDDVTKIWIPLKLDGIFLYFQTLAFTLDEMQRCDVIEYVLLSPEAEIWDPYSETYALNEEHIVDAGREIV